MGLSDKPDSRPVSYGDLVAGRWYDNPEWKIGEVEDHGFNNISMADVESADHIVLLLSSIDFELLLSSAIDGVFEPAASKFPEVTTGDFPPDVTLDLHNEIKGAIITWLKLNYPK